MAGDARAVMLFDGVCNFCNFAVRFVLPRDPAGRVRFAAMQSPAGQAMLRRLGMPLDEYATFAVVQEGRVYSRSDGVLRLTALMRWPWPLLGLCRIVPRRIRDGLYDLVARNRYRLMGRRARCRVPSPAERGRFLQEPADSHSLPNALTLLPLEDP